MAGKDDGAVVEPGQLLRQAVVHRFRVAARQIAAATGSDKQGITRDQMILYQKTLRAWRMTGCVEKGDVDAADAGGVAAVDLNEIRPHRLHELRFCPIDIDFSLGPIEESFDAVDMVEMAVRNENFRDRQVVFLGHCVDAIHIPGRINDRHLTRIGIADEIDIVPHWPQLNLFQVNRWGHVNGPPIGLTREH